MATTIKLKDLKIKSSDGLLMPFRTIIVTKKLSLSFESFEVFSVESGSQTSFKRALTYYGVDIQLLASEVIDF